MFFGVFHLFVFGGVGLGGVTKATTPTRLFKEFHRVPPLRALPVISLVHLMPAPYSGPAACGGTEGLTWHPHKEIAGDLNVLFLLAVTLFSRLQGIACRAQTASSLFW